MSLTNYPELPPIVLPSHFTVSLEKFCQWTHSPEFPEQGEISFIGGEVIINMSPERAETHNKIKTKITSLLDQLTSNSNLGTLYSDGMRLANKLAGLSTEPDAMFATFETLRSGRLQGDASTMKESVNLLGSPDWVLEIVSPSSVRKDKELLPARYFAAGIPEYWLIDALGDEIEFTLYIQGPNGYVRAEPTDGWAYSPVFDRQFQLTRQHDQIGLWQYTLAMREVERNA